MKRFCLLPILLIALTWGLAFSGPIDGGIVGGIDWSAAAITGGTIDDTVIGGTTPAAGTFTDVTAQSATPSIALNDTTSSKTADGFINNTAGDNDDAVLTIGVDDSNGDDQTYIELDGVNENITLSKFLDTYEFGHASDTTIARSGAGEITIESNVVYRAGGTDVAVTDGGTGVGTFTDHGVLVGSGTSAPTALSVGTAKQVLKGVASADPAFADDRDFSTQAYTEDGSITEAQVLANKYLTNQGDTGEADLTLPDLEYYVNVIFVVTEAQVMEINPPNADAHEAFDLDGTVLDASDCIDMGTDIGDKLSATRVQIDDGTWKWSFDTIRGTHVDTEATDP